MLAESSKGGTEGFRKTPGPIRSYVNAKCLILECVRVLNEVLVRHVLMMAVRHRCGRKIKSNIGLVFFLTIRRINRKLNIIGRVVWSEEG